jgi:capsid protein
MAGLSGWWIVKTLPEGGIMAADNKWDQFKALVGLGKPESQNDSARKIKASYGNYDGSYHQYAVTFNGEKNLGEIGPIKNYRPDYAALRLRSWQAYLESEIAQTILKKFTKWVIGSGLKLQAEPEKKVLATEKIKLTSEEFNEIAEARFSIFAKSKNADYSGMKSLHRLAKDAFLNSKIGGDVLVVLRYINDEIKVQLIDGAHVRHPLGNSDFVRIAASNGNEIRHGIELSATGEHVAYYVHKGGLEYERIPAKGSESGLTMAFLIYGFEYRLDDVRGLPLLSAVLETLKKLERYKEATVGGAEERQKIAYFIEHMLGSTGENPLAKNLAKAFSADANTDEIPLDVQGKQMADTIAVSTNKQVFNMPIQSTLKAVEGKGELYFKDFYTVLGNLICSSVNIPPDVAFSKYDSNFSASRAALKDWEHTLLCDRGEFAADFYQPIYNFFLEIGILTNKIPAPGYLMAKLKGNNYIVEAYRNARFVGASVPHIDPLKEVTAERLKLGSTGAAIPLTTVEAATELLNCGDADHNMNQYADELSESKSLGIKEELPPAPIPPTGD